MYTIAVLIEQLPLSPAITRRTPAGQLDIVRSFRGYRRFQVCHGVHSAVLRRKGCKQAAHFFVLRTRNAATLMAGARNRPPAPLPAVPVMTKRQGASRFELRRKLAEDGLGVVYAALDRDRGMQVALEKLRRVDASTLYRFKREFRILSELSHPNIVTLYELVSEGDDWFLSMEMVEGQDFLAFVCGQPHPDTAGADTAGAAAPGPPAAPPAMPVDEARLRQGLVQLAQALMALHEHGMVHRDLRPANVQVTEQGRVVLMHFGVMAEVGERFTPPARARAADDAAFMAPELRAGEAPSAAADWYALGAMLHAALTGQVRPASVRDQVPPSTVVGEIPADLDHLCRDLLAHRPEDRPGGGEVLARLGVRAARARSPAPAAGHAAIDDEVFVGRTDELARLGAAYRQATAGAMVCVLVRGASGMGKSTLVARFLRPLAAQPHADDGAEPPIVLRGRCHERESLSYKALDGVIDDLSRQLVTLPQERVTSLLPAEVDLLPRLFPVLHQVPGVRQARPLGACDPAALRARAVAAMRALLSNLADWRPLVIHIDDLQWSDRDSLDLLSELLRPPALSRVMLILSMRGMAGAERGTAGIPKTDDTEDAEDVLHDATDALAARAGHHITLGPLSAAEQHQLVTSLLRADPADSAPARPPEPSDPSRWWAQAQGHPLLLVELVSDVRQAAWDHAWEPSLHQIMERRIERLPDPARALLDAVVIAGEPTSLRVLARAIERSTASCERAAALLRISHLARVTRSGREPWLAPYHDMVREVIMARMTAARCQALHRSLALVLEGGEQATADTLARHWLAAGDEAQATAYLVAAARAASDKLAFERAADLYRAALDLAPPAAPAPAALLRALGDALALAGRSFDAAQAYARATAHAGADEAVELHRLAADNLLRSGHIAEGLRQMADVAQTLGVPVAHPRHALLSLALQRARLRIRRHRYTRRSERDIPARALGRLDTLYATATALGLIDHIRGAAVQVHHLRAALHHGEERRVCLALAAELLFLAMQGGRHLARAHALSRDVLLQARRLGEPYVLAVAHSSVGAVLLVSCQYARAAQSLAEAIRLLTAKVVGGHWEVVNARHLWCLAQLGMGNLAQMAPVVARALDSAGRSQDLYALTMFGAVPNAWRLLAADRAGELLDSVQRTWAMWPDKPDYLAHCSLLGAEAMVHLYRRDAAAACACLADYRRRLRALKVTRIPWLMTQFLMLEAEVAVLAGDRGTAARNAARLDAYAMPVSRGYAASIRAALAQRGGRLDAAERLWSEALALFRGCDCAHRAAAASYRLGSLLGPANGAALLAAADVWMQAQGIGNPQAMMGLLAPGS